MVKQYSHDRYCDFWAWLKPVDLATSAHNQWLEAWTKCIQNLNLFIILTIKTCFILKYKWAAIETDDLRKQFTFNMGLNWDGSLIAYFCMPFFLIFCLKDYQCVWIILLTYKMQILLRTIYSNLALKVTVSNNLIVIHCSIAPYQKYLLFRARKKIWLYIWINFNQVTRKSMRHWFPWISLNKH